MSSNSDRPTNRRSRASSPSDSSKLSTDDSRSVPSKIDTAVNLSSNAATHPNSVVIRSPFSGRLGRYELLGEIGRGGMGAVFLADDTILKRKVALKIPQFETQKAEQTQARFLREAQMAAQLSHPNICQVFDVTVIDGQYVMAMEYVDGKTLAEFAKAGKLLKERQAVQLIKKIGLAIEAAHHKGLIHRDLKPSNIMLPKPDPTRKSIEPKVMDFGLAKSFDSKATDLTKSGMIVGTPCYMSKEQWSGKDARLGPECDVYSLGVILYELLTGKLPYDVEDDEPATSWLVKLLTQPQIRPSERKPDIDAALEPIVMRAIATDAQDRYATMSDFAADLDAWLKGKPTTGQTLVGIQLGSMPSMVALATKYSVRGRRSETRPPWKFITGFGGAAIILSGMTFWFSLKSDWKGKAKTNTGYVTPDPTQVRTEEPDTSVGSPARRLELSSSSSPSKPESPITIEGTSAESTSSKLEDAPGQTVEEPNAESRGISIVSLPKIVEAFAGTKAGEGNELVSGMTFHWCPDGEFLMGSPNSELGYDGKRYNNEDQVEVSITGFWLSETEVTQGQWKKLMGTKPWHGKKYVREGEDFPASYMTHGDAGDGTIQSDSATAFCRRLTAQEREANRLPSGWKYALPTEAQWEYACRAGSQTTFSFGDNESQLSDYAWYAKNGKSAGESYAHQVRKKEPNEWGFFDINGNVWEWCSDWYNEKLPGGPDPVGASSGKYHIYRGGGWYSGAAACRSAYRGRYSQNDRQGDIHFHDSDTGFRVAAVLSTDDAVVRDVLDAPTNTNPARKKESPKNKKERVDRFPVPVGRKWAGIVRFPGKTITHESGMTITKVDGNKFTAEYFWKVPNDMRRLELKCEFTDGKNFTARPTSMLGGRWNSPGLLDERWKGTVENRVISMTRYCDAGEFEHTLTLVNAED